MAKSTTSMTRPGIVASRVEASLLTEFSNEDLTAVLLNIRRHSKGVMGLIVRSVYMPYDSAEPPPQKEVKQLVAFAKERRLNLLLGCDANSHHLV